MGKNSEKSEYRVLLFDIDGVLVSQGGYRKAFTDTVSWFMNYFGFPEIQIGREFADRFDAYGVLAEWDMVPLTLSFFLDWYAENNPQARPFGKLEKLNNLPRIHPAMPFPEVLWQKIPQIQDILNGEDIPALAVYKHCLDQKDQSILPRIWDDSVLSELLADSLNVRTSWCFQKLETYILGSELFEKTFHIPTEKGIPSGLMTVNKALLNEKYRKKILEMNGKSLYVATITARPNLLPACIKDDKTEIISAIPEAEIAMDELGWGDGRIKNVGVGILHYYEKKRGLPQDSRLKPNPFHALFAILYAISDSFEKTFNVVSTWDFPEKSENKINPFLPILPEGSMLDIAVFEDSLSGIQSATDAAKILQNYGYIAQTRRYGIYTNPEKAELMKTIGTKCFPTINDALDQYFSETDQ